MCIELTDRDRKFLYLLSKSGVVTYEHAAQVYETDQYHYRRVQKLRKYGYVKKTGKYLRLTPKGANAVGVKLFNPSQFFWEDYSAFAEVYLGLTNWKVFSFQEVRQTHRLNRRMFLKGAIEKDDLTYTVYLLRPNVSLRYVSYIKSEMATLRYAVQFDRAVVFAPSVHALQSFGEDTCHMKEILLLPYPYGINLLNNFIRVEYQEYINSLVSPAEPTDKPFANYEDSEYYYSNLILNDLVKRKCLAEYFRYSSSTKPVKILCLGNQRGLFTNLFPEAGIKIVEEPENILNSFGEGGENS